MERRPMFCPWRNEFNFLQCSFCQVSYIWFLLVLSIALSWCKIPNLIFSTLWKASKSTFWNKSKLIQPLYLSASHPVHLPLVCMCVSLTSLFLSASLYSSVQISAYLHFHLFIFPCTFYFFVSLSAYLYVFVSVCLSVLPSTQPNPIQSSLTNSGLLYIRNYVPLIMTLQASVS